MQVDMLDLFNIDDRRKSRWLASLMTCERCEEPLADGGVYMGDTWYCRDCAHHWVDENLVKEPILIDLDNY